MKRTVTMIMVLATILGSMAIATTMTSDKQSLTARAADDNTTLALIWDTLNDTNENVLGINTKLDAMSDQIGELTIRVNSSSNLLNDVILRMGYDADNISIFNIRDDFDRLYQALYYSNEGTFIPILKTTDGGSNLKMINDNQLALANKTDRISGYVLSAETSINDHMTAEFNGIEFNVYSIFIIVLVTVFMITIFMVWYFYSRKGSIHEIKGGSAESLFMPPPMKMEVAPILPDDDMPECYKTMYNGNSSDCKACGVRDDCSGRPARRVPIRPKPGKTPIKVQRRAHA